MSDQPVTVNKAATIANEVLHALILDVAVPVIEAEVAAAGGAVTANPVVKFIDDEAIQFVARRVYEILAQETTDVIIDVQVGVEKAEANKAKAELQSAAASGDEAARLKAREDFKNAFGRLVHSDGSARP